jgi:hypothetical protein
MSQSKLHDLLEELHAKLSAREPGPMQDPELIKEVISDLNRLLRGDTDSPLSAQAPVLAAQAVRLEASHPDLVPIIRRIVEVLGQAGM